MGVPKDMINDEIRRDLIHHNLESADNPDIKVVYMYTPIDGSPVTRCVVEIPPDVRAKLQSAFRIYLGFSSCVFKDHVRIRHCYKCLALGHLSSDCTGDLHCGHCGGT